MSYNDFLNTLVSPITYFVSWLGTIANYLITNYIFITLIGLSLFISFVYFIYNIISYNINFKDFDIDKKLDKKSNDLEKR